MTVRRAFVVTSKWAGLLFAHLVLFIVGTAVFVPKEVAASMQTSPEAQGAELLSMALIALLDLAILGGIAAGSRLRGWRLWALLSGFFYFVKTFTSQLEAGYFMRNVSMDMLPWLLAMTLPLCLLLPPLIVTALGRWKADPSQEPAWRAPALPRGDFALRVALLSAVGYPFFFFAAGYFIAWQSPAIREFYSGSTDILPPLAHFAKTFSDDPKLYFFEIFRGLLWVGAALAVLRTVKGPWWVGTLLVALSFCFIQNSMHLLENPLMVREVRLYHFVETGSSNFLFALCIGWLLNRDASAASHDAPQLGMRTRAA